MSTQLGKLCSLILLEHFGKIIQKIGDDLFRWGSKPLHAIVVTTGLPLKTVREALCVLIQFGLVTFAEGSIPNKPEYTFSSDKILLFLRYPRYLMHLKTHFGDEAEVLFEEILKQGHDTASATIIRTANRINASSNDETDKVTMVMLRDKFSMLATKQFLMRCPSTESDMESLPQLRIHERELFQPPEIDLKDLILKQQGEPTSPGNAGEVHWRVNFDKFHQDFRDEMMVSAISRRVDNTAGELMRHLLQQMYLRTEAWASTSNPIPFTELRDVIRRQNLHPQLLQYLEQYVRIMDEDSSKFITKVGDSGGGQYMVNMKDAFTELTWTTIENIVMERFGSKAARIFRLVRAKEYAEQEQIQQVAMIPAKEAKLLTYKLLEENFLQMQELRKAIATNAPNKTFFLFYINLHEVTRMVLEICYKAMFNAMLRRGSETKENRRIMEKHHRIKTIAATLRAQGALPEQVAEIEEMISPPELALLDKAQVMIHQLSEAELQLDDNIFLLQLYLGYEQ